VSTVVSDRNDEPESIPSDPGQNFNIYFFSFVLKKTPMLCVKVNLALSVDELNEEFETEMVLKKLISWECDVEETSFDVNIEPDGEKACYLSINFPSPEADVIDKFTMETIGEACGVYVDQIFTISFMKY